MDFWAAIHQYYPDPQHVAHEAERPKTPENQRGDFTSNHRPLVDKSPPTTRPELATEPRLQWILAACCAVAFAKLVDPQAWMMGLDIPESAFGAAWSDYRGLAAINVLLLMGFLLLGGVLGDALGRRRILLFGASLATLANVLATLSPTPPWFVVARAVEGFGSALALPMTLAVIRLTFQGRALPLALLVYTFVTVVAALTSLLMRPASDRQVAPSGLECEVQ